MPEATDRQHTSTRRSEVDAITAAWARERPGMSVEAMAVVTRIWQLAKVFGDQRRRVVADGGADQATLDLLSVLRRAGPPYELAPGRSRVGRW